MHLKALKIVTVLWVIWGLVYIFAENHPVDGGVRNSHGFNLLWIGIAILVQCPAIAPLGWFGDRI